MEKAVVAGSGDPERAIIVRAARAWSPQRGVVGEAVGIRGGRIVAVGTLREVRARLGGDADIWDFGEALILPGFTDAHAHLATLGSLLFEVDLRGARSRREALERVREFARAHRDRAWITGYGWDQSLWPDRRFPTAEELSEVVPDRPVFLRRVGGHAAWVNLKALQLAGIGPDTPDPPGGEILRTPDGRPTGVLLDEAMGLVSRILPPPTEQDLREYYLAAQRECLRYGLTCVHDAGLDERDVRILKSLDREGVLKLRVYGMLHAPSGPGWGRLAEPPERVDPAHRFVLRAVKVFADGAMGSRGAWLFEPYADDPDSVGLVLTPPGRIEAITRQCLRTGWQVCTHAIGDRANAEVLAAYARALRAVQPPSDPRLRIEHAQVVRPGDIPLFQELGLIASMQPTHATTDMRWAERRLGKARLRGAYAWRSMLNAGVRLAFGSDFPVESPSPWLGLYAAVTRQDANGNPPGGWLPEQRLSLEEAVRAYTEGGAFAAFAEKTRGKLEPGYDADLIVIRPDIFSVEPKRLLDVEVLATIIGGECVWRAASHGLRSRSDRH